MPMLSVDPGLPDGFSIPAGTARVQFCKPLSRSDYEILAKELRGRPEVLLRAFQLARTEFTDLNFLAHFPHVRRLAIDLFWLTNIDGFEAIEDLDELAFGWTNKKSYSLNFLRRFGSIKKLYLEGAQERH